MNGAVRHYKYHIAVFQSKGCFIYFFSAYFQGFTIKIGALPIVIVDCLRVVKFYEGTFPPGIHPDNRKSGISHSAFLTYRQRLNNSLYTVLHIYIVRNHCTKDL